MKKSIKIREQERNRLFVITYNFSGLENPGEIEVTIEQELNKKLQLYINYV